MIQTTAIDKIRRPGSLALRIEPPLVNDWSPAGRPCGVPDLTRHSELVREVDELGFAAIWMRDVSCSINPAWEVPVGSTVRSRLCAFWTASQ